MRQPRNMLEVEGRHSPNIDMFSDLFLTATNHHTPKQKTRAKMSVGLVTLRKEKREIKIEMCVRV